MWQEPGSDLVLRSALPWKVEPPTGSRDADSRGWHARSRTRELGLHRTWGWMRLTLSFPDKPWKLVNIRDFSSSVQAYRERQVCAVFGSRAGRAGGPGGSRGGPRGWSCVRLTLDATACARMACSIQTIWGPDLCGTRSRCVEDVQVSSLSLEVDVSSNVMASNMSQIWGRVHGSTLPFGARRVRLYF